MPLTSLSELTPVSFLNRSEIVFADRPAIVDGPETFTYREFGARVRALTGALAVRGVEPGDRVGVLATNSHVMLELHQGIPRRGAVLVTLNIRLSEPELAFILRHSGCSLLVATHEFEALATRLAGTAGIDLLLAAGESSPYERALETAPATEAHDVRERDLLAINYTSGTTGRPKGVMYHHRGAYLQALAMCHHNGFGPDSAYLWTLPMFHCNGWCCTWAVTAAGGTHVCLRQVDPARIWQLIGARVTHLSAAPTVLAMIAEHPGAVPAPRAVQVATGGAPPSPTLLRRLAVLNFETTHLYGLTETFGPVVVNQWQHAWDELPDDEIFNRKARQGVGNVISNRVRVATADGTDVPADGASIGEILISGNNLMLGYYRDEAATEAASLDGWFRTGDLAVMHPDGYVEIRDRLKDIIISGGENIASVEVERAIDAFPGVLESAVVGASDPRWGEVPVAFVTPRQSATIDVDELQRFLRQRLAGYKVPRRYVVTELPKTSTGKIRKNQLRESIQNPAGPATG